VQRNRGSRFDLFDPLIDLFQFEFQCCSTIEKIVYNLLIRLGLDAALPWKVVTR
jgi:hypothetical protein